MLCFIESESWFQPIRKYLLTLPRNKDTEHRAFLEAFLMRHLLKIIRRNRQYYRHCNAWFYQYLYLCISCLFQRGEDGKGSPSLHCYVPCLSWRIQQIRRWSIFINISQYFSIFLRIFSFIVTIIFRCNGKIQKVARETWRKSPNQVIWWLLFLIFGQN